MLVCALCGGRVPETTRQWRCACSGYFDVDNADAIFAPRDDLHGVWRYASSLPVKDPASVVSFGEGATPLIKQTLPLPDGSFGTPYCKLDYLCPSGSYKDRGMVVMLARLYELGITDIVEDSSGNAGASMAMYMAAYASRYGKESKTRCRIFVPESTSLGKCTQIAAHGATLVRVAGSREATTVAAEAAAATAYYASHNWSPYFVHGIKTYALEIVEQLGEAPENLIVPLGQGSLVLGAHLAFTELLQAGVIRQMPKIYGVQSAACAPLHRAFVGGVAVPTPLLPEEKGMSLAEGIASAAPVRGAQILQVVRASGGEIVAVDDPALVVAFKALAGAGIYVEPTSAVVMAAWWELLAAGRMARDAKTVLFFSGSGLKATATLQGLVFGEAL